MSDSDSDFLTKRYKTLLIAAHPDDESIGASFLMQNHSSLHVSFCTDGGAPLNQPVWTRIGLRSRNEYVALREREALDALKRSHSHFQPEFHRKLDGSLHRALRETAVELRHSISIFRPDFLLTHSFEHGHPDHDCCSFLAAQLGAEFHISVWEMPIYGLIRGLKRVQDFADNDNGILRIQPTPEEIELKRSMLNAHESQVKLGNLNEFDPTRPESYRPQPSYAFLNAPPDFQYAVETATPQEVVAAFAGFTEPLS
ncbi:MAG TPA: PIG-L family deacetylase [Terriglobales bacterium]|jgi:LmbE family N-acetylglucosaminyl deacetylase|nr:PIG-L family deacetylase [Terriglobales bacterium]